VENEIRGGTRGGRVRGGEGEMREREREIYVSDVQGKNKEPIWQEGGSY